jgi:hypothetical protein
MTKRLYKIAGPPQSDGLNSCPTVIGVTDEERAVAEIELALAGGTPLGTDDMVLQGYELDADTRRRLNIPEGENAIVMPKALYLEGARRVAEGG